MWFLATVLIEEGRTENAERGTENLLVVGVRRSTFDTFNVLYQRGGSSSCAMNQNASGPAVMRPAARRNAGT